MFRIAKSLITIAAVAAIAVGATGAYFTSQASVPAMTFASGTLNISVDSDSYVTRNSVTTPAVTFTNLKPGDTIRQWVTLHNTGSLDVGQLTVQAINVVDPGGLLGQVKVSVIGFDNSPPFPNNAYFTPGWGTGGSAINSWLTVSPEDILSPSAVQWSPGPTPSVIASGQDDLIVLDYTVPTTMGDAYQGLTATFDLQFHAEQVH